MAKKEPEQDNTDELITIILPVINGKK